MESTKVLLVSLPFKFSLDLLLGLVPSDLIRALTYTLMGNLGNGRGGCSTQFDSNQSYIRGSRTTFQTGPLVMYCAKPYKAP